MKIFVHGVPDTRHIWTPLVTELGMRPNDCEKISLPGFGCARPKNFPSTMDAYAEWLLYELDQLYSKHGQPLDLVGHDWGALLCSRICCLKPHLVRSLVLSGAAIDASYRGHLFAWLWATPLVGELVMAAITSARMKKSFRAQGLPEELATHEAAQINKDMKESILRLYRSAKGLRNFKEWDRDLQNLSCKLLLLWGAQDPYVPLSIAENFVAKWGGNLHIESDAGHWSIASHAKSVAPILKRFWLEL